MDSQSVNQSSVFFLYQAMPIKTQVDERKQRKKLLIFVHPYLVYVILSYMYQYLWCGFVDAKTLDLIERMCKSAGYLLLRLDGQTPTSRRMELVERFNCPSSPECKPIVYCCTAQIRHLHGKLVAGSPQIFAGKTKDRGRNATGKPWHRNAFVGIPLEQYVTLWVILWDECSLLGDWRLGEEMCMLSSYLLEIAFWYPTS